MNQTNPGDSDSRSDDTALHQEAEAVENLASQKVEETARASREMTEQASRAEREAVEQNPATADEAANHLTTDATDFERENAAQANSLGQETAEAGGPAAHTGADVIAHNAEAIQRALRSGLSLATQLSEQSLVQFARILDLAGERTKEASEHSARHVEAIMQSSTVLSGGFEAISRELIDFARNHMSCQRDRTTQVLRARTPQDLAVIQTEMLRDNIESFLQSFRRVAEVSARVSEDAARKLSDDAERPPRTV
ncbi:MAG: phasin family protein [Bradyrhizobiaceae bacterium]|nr:phasin family protein [Bradyrhizobiaceae bacterium]